MAEFDKLNEILSRKPTRKELSDYSHGMSNAIFRDKSLAMELGYDVAEKRPNGYWTREKIEKEMNEIIKILGHYPNQRELTENGYGHIKSALARKYGGLHNLGLSIGHDISRKPPGYWDNMENIKKEYKNVLKKLGYFPSSEGLKNAGFSSLANAIMAHGGYKNLGKMRIIRYEPKMHEHGYWKIRKNVESELKKVILKLGHFPTHDEIKKEDGTLSGAIIHFGGISKFENLGYKSRRIPNGYFKDIEKIRDEMHIIIRKIGHYPKARELEKINRRLLSGITKYHGYNKVKSLFGYSALDSEEDFIKFVGNDDSLKKLVKKLGNDPVTLADIISIKYSDSLQRNDLVKFFNERPALRDYMGRFATGIRDWEDFQRLADLTLPFDKGEKIKGILIKKGIEYALKDMGHNPTNNEVEEKIAEIGRRLYDF